MESLKWTVCLLYIYIKVFTTETRSWTVDVPSSIKGLPGYCVVIPCSFNFPNSKKKLTQFTGMWYNSRNQLIYHPVETQIMQTYWNRTALLGNLSQKNCSLEIDPLNDHDKGPFHFRVEITGLDSYSFIHEKVSISMISELDPVSLSVTGEVRADRAASACCSVTHSCPTSPPDFTWSHRGRAEVQHTKLNGGQWRSASTLSFQPSRENHNQSLRCSVIYKGGQTQEATKLFRVSYAPEIRKTSACTSGAKWMTCVCIVESSPPSGVQFLLPGGISNSTDVMINGTVTIGILQTEPGPHQFIHCLANNTLGRANLTLSVAHSRRTKYLFIFIAVGGVLLALVIQTLATVVQNWISCPPPNRGRTGGAQTSQLKSCPRKMTEGKGDGNCYPVDHLYSNMQAPVHEPIYANM